MPGTASNSPHHIGVPSCFAWYSSHVSRSLMEGLVSGFFSSAAGSLFSGSWKLTLLFWGLPRDWDCTHQWSVWGWLWLWVLTQPLEWSLDQFLDQVLGRLPDLVLGWLLLWLQTCDLSLCLSLILSRSSWRASAVSKAFWWVACGAALYDHGGSDPTHSPPWAPRSLASTEYICLCNWVCREESISCITLLLLDSPQEGDPRDLLRRYMLWYTFLISLLDVWYPTNSIADWSALGLGSSVLLWWPQWHICSASFHPHPAA